jgi:hypothetical protein
VLVSLELFWFWWIGVLTMQALFIKGNAFVFLINSHFAVVKES